MLTRNAALELLKEHVTSESLIKHCMAVEGSMRAYALLYDEDVDLWGLTGLLHDIDFDKHPEEHPMHARKYLSDLDLPESSLTAIEEHGKLDLKTRDSLISKTLFAVDSLSSFILAYVHVRPDKSFDGIPLKSIKKKFKDKAFARAVNRDLILQGAQDLDVNLDTHMENVIQGIVEWETELNKMGFSLV
ncbi:MAG: HAD family hydrolase [Firmicutes bacterium HGW-Firmicutes-5]|nr:MAG: HAD family hydrolase [Firmicutes bacterium HGW-Firmicutes-5]